MSASDIKALVRVIALSIANNEEGAEEIVKWAYRDSEPQGNRKARPKKEDALLPPYTSERFMQTLGSLLSQPKWKGKTNKAIQLSLDKLAKYDEQFAIMLMEDAIEHNWQGVVFSDTDERYRQYKGKTRPKDKNDVNALWER